MTTKDQRLAAINTAIERGGGIVRFSKALGVTHQAVYFWKRKGYVPLDKAIGIECLVGTPREDLIDPKLLQLINAPNKAAEDLL